MLCRELDAVLGPALELPGVAEALNQLAAAAASAAALGSASGSVAGGGGGGASSKGSTKGTDPKAAVNAGGAASGGEASGVVLLADWELLDLPLEMLGGLRRRGLRPLARDFSAHVLAARFVWSGGGGRVLRPVSLSPSAKMILPNLKRLSLF